ncbi:MAG: PAS domain S-box protein [Sandaracinaceae bacterium]|nr:PAS domain S-box protein [Sandaracinaceae bacterium]
MSDLVGALVAAVEWDAGLLWQTGDATALLGAVLPRAPALKAASKGRAPLPPGSHVPAQLEDRRAAAAARDGLRTALVIEVPAAAGGALAFELFSQETNLLEPRLATELDAALRVVAAGMERARLARVADDLFEISPDAQLIVNDGVIRRVSRAADGLLGYRAHELVGLSVETLVPEARRDAHREQREAATASAHNRAMGERRLQARGKDGRERTVEISLARSSLGLLAAVRDVTERVAVEARAEHAERLDGLRRVSAGLAHHLNTPLQIATSNAEFLESMLGELVERAKGERLAPPSPRAKTLFD